MRFVGQEILKLSLVEMLRSRFTFSSCVKVNLLGHRHRLEDM